MDELILAKLGATHGVNGCVKLISHSGEVQHLLALKNAKLQNNAKSLNIDIEYIKVNGSNAVIKIKGYDSPESAKVLSGMDLLANRDNAAPLYENQYYYADIEGCSLVLADEAGLYTKLATVLNICDGGNGQLLEVKKNNGEICFVPFIKEFIGFVDIDKKTIQLTQAWVLDDADKP